METSTSYVGTWDEIKAHEKDLDGQFLVVEVIRDPAIAARLARLEDGLTKIREIGEGMGPFPHRKITLDVLYPDVDEPR